MGRSDVRGRDGAQPARRAPRRLGELVSMMTSAHFPHASDPPAFRVRCSAVAPFISPDRSPRPPAFAPVAAENPKSGDFSPYSRVFTLWTDLRSSGFPNADPSFPVLIVPFSPQL